MATALSAHITLLDGGERRLLAGIDTDDATGIDAYRRRGGYGGLERAITDLGPEAVIGEIESAGLRGRGGAGYQASAKWRVAREAQGDRRIVVANLMGADPASLGDRALAEGNPHAVVEGLLVAAFATGASEAVLAVRRDWSLAIERLRAAVEAANAARLAGYLVLGTDVSIQLSVWEGSGAYVAGEETALIHALQGDRGMPQIRPPYPVQTGLWNAPTVVHNAETLAHVAWIAGRSSDEFRHAGSSESPGTKLVTLMGRVAKPGVAEVPLGLPLRDVIALAGGGAGRTKAVFVGGPAGGALRADELDLAYDYEPLQAAGAVIGSGAVLVTDDATCMVGSARYFLDFSAREACGKAVPCRIGTKRLVEALDRILAAAPRPDDFVLLRSLSRKVADTALCRLEQLAPGPMLSTLARFPDEYRAHAERGECLSGAHPALEVPPLLEPLPGLEPAARA